MAITGIDTIEGKQIIAAGAVSAKSAEMAYNDENGNPITGYLTAVPNTYLQNTDLTITDGKITEISGVPLSAGDELPESVSAATDYVTATSANIDSTIDNVSANSGAWGGSALPISAGPGIKFEMVDNTLVARIDETVLWSGDALSATVSESLSNFDSIKVYAHWSYNDSYEARTMTEIPGSATNFNLFTITPAETTSQTSDARVYTLASIYNINGLDLTPINKSRIQYAAAEGSISCNTYSNIDVLKLTKVAGINRISGGN